MSFTLTTEQKEILSYIKYGKLLSHPYIVIELTCITPSSIACGCKELLDSLNNLKKVHFALADEFKFHFYFHSRNLLEIRLIINVVKWYDEILRPYYNNEESFIVATNYIEEIRKFQINIEHHEENLLLPLKNDFNSLFTKRICFDPICLSKMNPFCSYHHLDFPFYCCSEEILTTNNSKRKCYFGTIKEYVINEQSTANERYFVLLRPEAFREFLVCPKPCIRMDNSPTNKNNHQKNEDMCIDECFWSFLLKWCEDQHLELQRDDTCPRLSLNFGKWESGIANNINIKECHAHLHLYLTIAEYNEFKNIEFQSGNSKIKSFLGRFKTPKFYFKEDLDELENNRLNLAYINYFKGYLNTSSSNNTKFDLSIFVNIIFLFSHLFAIIVITIFSLLNLLHLFRK